MSSRPYQSFFRAFLAFATAYLVAGWTQPPLVAQVRPLVLEESSRSRRMGEPQLLPPRRAELMTLWEVESGGTLLPGIIGGAGAVVYGLREGQLVSRSTADGRQLWMRPLPGLEWAPQGLDRRLIVVHGRILEAMDPGDGSTLWTRALTAPAAFAPVVTSTRIMVTLASGRLAAFQPETGEPLWELDPGCMPAVSPHLQGDLIVVGCPDGVVRAFRAGDAYPLWEHRLKQPPLVRAAVAGDRVFLGTSEHAVICLGARNGKQRYRVRMAGNPAGELQIHEDLLLAGSHDNLLYAIRQRRGYLAWSADAGARLLGPVTMRANLAASSPPLATQLVILDLRDGAILAREPLPGEDRISAAPPHFAGLTLVTASQPVSGGAGWLTGHNVEVRVLDRGPLSIPHPASTR